MTVRIIKPASQGNVLSKWVNFHYLWIKYLNSMISRYIYIYIYQLNISTCLTSHSFKSITQFLSTKPDAFQAFAISENESNIPLTAYFKYLWAIIYFSFPPILHPSHQKGFDTTSKMHCKTTVYLQIHCYHCHQSHHYPPQEWLPNPPTLTLYFSCCSLQSVLHMLNKEIV